VLHCLGVTIDNTYSNGKRSCSVMRDCHGQQQMSDPHVMLLSALGLMSTCAMATLDGMCAEPQPFKIALTGFAATVDLDASASQAKHKRHQQPENFASPCDSKLSETMLNTTQQTRTCAVTTKHACPPPSTPARRGHFKAQFIFTAAYYEAQVLVELATSSLVEVLRARASATRHPAPSHENL
jgi:hypothetical protein